MRTSMTSVCTELPWAVAPSTGRGVPTSLGQRPLGCHLLIPRCFPGGSGLPCKLLPALLPGKASAFLSCLKTGGAFLWAPGTAPPSGLRGRWCRGVQTRPRACICVPACKRGADVCMRLTLRRGFLLYRPGPLGFCTECRTLLGSPRCLGPWLEATGCRARSRLQLVVVGESNGEVQRWRAGNLHALACTFRSPRKKQRGEGAVWIILGPSAHIEKN